jgi:hypothetical protein
VSALIAMIVAVLFDPVIIIPGLISGYFNRNWVVLAVCALIIAIAHEALLSAMQSARIFEPAQLVIAIGAALLWGMPTFLSKKKQES